MLMRLDMTLCVSSKVDRYQMAKDVFDKIKALQVVLPMLLEGAQLVRVPAAVRGVRGRTVGLL